jgi:NAD(P)-dependent dehydrogenase (short-subunit alcohol dehydrogenase family)
VYFGDWDDTKGRQVEQELQSQNTGGSVHFQKLDVRDYNSQLALFEAPFKDHGRVDVAVSCAAVKEPGGWFEPETLDLTTVLHVSERYKCPLSGMYLNNNKIDFRDPRNPSHSKTTST